MNRAEHISPFLFFITLFIFLTGCEKQPVVGPETGTITDFEGNVYPTVKIGTQWWMAKNLKSAKYSNGDNIGTTVSVNQSITGVAEPKYHWAYYGNEGLAAVYGRLYTWHTATDPRNICPDGWHVPDYTEWNTLNDYLKKNNYGYEASNHIAKSLASESGWLLHGIAGNPGNDPAGNNNSGFTAMPGGLRQPNGNFLYAGGEAVFWSNTVFDSLSSWLQLVDFDQSDAQFENMDKKTGLSIRCIKNE